MESSQDNIKADKLFLSLAHKARLAYDARIRLRRSENDDEMRELQESSEIGDSHEDESSLLRQPHEGLGQ